MDNNNAQLVTLNMEAVKQTARLRYMTARTRKRTLKDWIDVSVSAWLLVIVFAVFLLSAPHTSTMFNMITPGFGFAGVLLVESGLLYLAFRRKQDGRLPITLRVFEALLFLAAIIVNGAGALVAVVSFTGIQSMSAQGIYGQFPALPITAQVGLLLVPLAAVLIPIGTVVTGEGFANFTLQDKRAKDDLDLEWAQNEQLEVYREAYSFLLHKGVNARDAQRRAGSATNNFYQSGLVAELPALTEEISVRAVSAASMPRTKRPATKKPSANKGKKDVRLAVRQYLDDHPTAIEMSVRDLAEAVGVGKTIAHEELSAYRDRKADVQ